ncbi:MAG: aldehyde dehydrogenase family protein [Pirellulaceae bacterium]
MTNHALKTVDEWTPLTCRQRAQVLGQVASEIQSSADELIELCRSDQRTEATETISAELLPLCAALAYLNKNAAKILQPRRCGFIGRPVWLWGVHSRVMRRPFGTVLVLGPWNYPLLLVGTQIAQSLVAGNHVLVKPAEGCEASTAKMVDCFYAAGVPRSHLTLLDSSVAAATDTIGNGVDLVVLTGGAQTGRKVMQQLAQTLTPSIMELSGCDAVVVLPGSDLRRVAKAIDFGLNFNSGATCIGPRRLFVMQESADEVIDAIRLQIADRGDVVVHLAARDHVADEIQAALRNGATNTMGGDFNAQQLRETGKMKPVVLDGVASTDPIASADIFAPVISVIRINEIDQAARAINRCRYRLAASVFGPSAQANAFANQLDVGSVTINDLVAPTADPRLPFGGRGQSGFGVTRGREGLLAMTVPVVVSERRGSFTPHLDRHSESLQNLVSGMLAMLHAAKWSERLSGLRNIIRSVKK